MSFPWYHVQRRPSRGRDSMYLREVEERTALLFRLGFSKQRARTRILSNVGWDFEIGAGPALSREAIDGAIDDVYRRGGLRHGAPSV